MKRPSTDALLIVLHWAVAGAVLLSLLTGFRIAADDPDALLAAWVRPLTLSGGIHSLHVWSSVALVAVAAGYLAYLIGAQGFSSLRLPRAGTRRPAPRVAWRRRNVLTYQLLFVLLGGMAATGLLLYTGWEPVSAVPLGWMATLHTWLAWALLGTVVFHVVAQYQFGATAGRGGMGRLRHGGDWLLKMLRPRLGRTPPRATLSAHPMTVAAASAAALAGGGGFLAIDGIAHAPLEVVDLGADPAPVLDGSGDDAVWRRAPVASVVTTNGANLPDGQSRVEVQAAVDAERIHFRFRWEDPTRSYKHLPLQKTEAGWRLLHTEYDIEDEDVFYEDKFAVLLTTWSKIAGGVTHMGPRPLEGHPGGMSGRGLHYTEDGSYADMWHWKSVRSQPLGGLDDDHFGPPAEPTPEQIAGTKRYKAGYMTDEGSISSEKNFASEGPGGYAGEVLPKHLPADLEALEARLGPIDLDSEASDAVPIAMTAEEAVPYTPQRDAEMPVGTVIPGIVLGEGGLEGDRGDVATGARWEDGWWTLEVSRRLDTGSPRDVAFEPGRAVFLWVAVFDHTQTRHSRHMRPLEVRLPFAADSAT